ncbi:hypothetical protein PHYBLDRAFT_146719 [Phycomyces blakesleeanus NRRL 1555(-)]|uniref:Uncharacterized protein n=1 Tax=Phycomyces blakesleeanus (strain ATCC 8743b / DSM 1359 / FGSC 10004 / NBRC 33097 / NRRL 1555) TaxID=763407 RepID=A0A162NA47_PHYB8|nr:hypothetical protein PHYBLDRAFT_146719 [Phycomyces blakesleeanus NRRL 1555(-)]OAD72528.1 hypothetical protein PHYBLDRAFT_146719 [Phycomyces blakesleeanus NRRL 1555(-)]|eukprot:XP_018290568.1 hypothetical protein PHYBLDRAFT_146719 [Phycomyces blakesleeanus NRRL 1555(-)]
MAPRNARSKIAHKRPRTENGKFGPKPPISIIDSENTIVEDDPVDENNHELDDLNTDMMFDTSHKKFLTWNPDAGNSLRELKAKKELEANKNKTIRTLADFGFSNNFPPVSYADEPQPVVKATKEQNLEEICIAFNSISDKVEPRASSSSKSCMISFYEASKHIVVKDYFRRLLGNSKKIDASQKAAEIIWHNPSKYRGEVVRAWGKEYLKFGRISESQQGKHSKRSLAVSN